MSRGIFIAFLLAAVLFTGCSMSDGPVASADGGGATETTNGYVVSSAGYPVDNASVKLVSQDEWLSRIISQGSPVVESTKTRWNGSFEVEYPEGGSYNVQIMSENQGLFIRNFDSIYSPGFADTFRLESFGSFSGEVLSGDSVPAKIRLAGTSLEAEINNDLSFNLEKVPQGDFPLVTVFGEVTYSTASFPYNIDISGDSSVSDAAVSGKSIVLLDDFKKDYQNSLSYFLTDGGWMTFYDSDAYSEGNTTLEPEYVSGSEAFDGKSLRCEIVLKDGFAEPYGGMGNFIGDRTKYYDFGNLEYLQCEMKGNGVVSVSLETLGLDTLSGEGAHFRYEVNLTPQWQTVRINVDSLYVSDSSPAALAGITWPDVSEKVNRIEWTVSTDNNSVNDTVVFYLDDVYLKGVGLEDLEE